MKRVIIYLLLAFIISSAYAAYPGHTDHRKDSTLTTLNNDVVNSIVAAISVGDASRLASFFNSTIDLTLPAGEGSYSKSQAEMMVKGFFTQNQPITFKVNQQGSSTEGSQFCIGTLTAKTGKFRTYFLVKKSGGVFLLYQLQFERE